MQSSCNADRNENKGRDNIKDGHQSDEDEDRFALNEEKPQVHMTISLLFKCYPKLHQGYNAPLVPNCL